MDYLKVQWAHDFPDEPVTFYSELGDDRYEVRKVQVYRDGRVEWADEDHETDTVGLSEVAVPSFEEIDDQAEFAAEIITADDFDAVWQRAVRTG